MFLGKIVDHHVGNLAPGGKVDLVVLIQFLELGQHLGRHVPIDADDHLRNAGRSYRPTAVCGIDAL